MVLVSLFSPFCHVALLRLLMIWIKCCWFVRVWPKSRWGEVSIPEWWWFSSFCLFVFYCLNYFKGQRGLIRCITLQPFCWLFPNHSTSDINLLHVVGLPKATSFLIGFKIWVDSIISLLCFWVRGGGRVTRTRGGGWNDDAAVSGKQKLLIKRLAWTGPNNSRFVRDGWNKRIWKGMKEKLQTCFGSKKVLLNNLLLASNSLIWSFQCDRQKVPPSQVVPPHSRCYSECLYQMDTSNIIPGGLEDVPSIFWYSTCARPVFWSLFRSFWILVFNIFLFFCLKSNFSMMVKSFEGWQQGETECVILFNSLEQQKTLLP